MRNRIWLLVLITVVAFGCGKEVTPPPANLAKATLVFPALNELCTAGTVVSATESTILFNWNASENADGYDLVIKNLLTNAVTTQASATNQLGVKLLRNTPYSWYVISKSTATTTTAQSDTWKFYNSGPGTVNYSPFPATITAPIFAQNVTAVNNGVNLTWTGADTDGDIAGYDVYFGTANTPPLASVNVLNMFLNNVTVAPNTTYYWKVITRDLNGNISDSGVYQFTVN